MLDAAAANLSRITYAVRESQRGITVFGGSLPYPGVLARDLPWVAHLARDRTRSWRCPGRGLE